MTINARVSRADAPPIEYRSRSDIGRSLEAAVTFDARGKKKVLTKRDRSQIQKGQGGSKGTGTNQDGLLLVWLELALLLLDRLAPYGRLKERRTSRVFGLKLIGKRHVILCEPPPSSGCLGVGRRRCPIKETQRFGPVIRGVRHHPRTVTPLARSGQTCAK